MPNARFYIRSHFHIPSLNADSYRLAIGGLVEHPLLLSLSDLRAMRSRSLVVTLECAGNGRTLFDPPIEGEKWDLGAVSTAEWTGVPLAELLELAGVGRQAREVLFHGADGGTVEGRSESIWFERSLPIGDPNLNEAVLAYAMNGEPLSTPHGYPLRLIVPNWYAVASVKWLTNIDLIEQPFDGFFQADRYWYQWERAGGVVSERVAVQRVRALITEPNAGQVVGRGTLAIRGVAWSGAAPIERVEVSLGTGDWSVARLLGDHQPGCWRWWELIAEINQPGSCVVCARATDRNGHTQPDHAEWNSLGYGNNSIQQVPISVA